MAITETITEPQQAAQYIYDLIKAQEGPLGIAFLGYNENLRPKYPAVIVYPGMKEKVLHSTHGFLVGLEVMIMVYHGKLNQPSSHRVNEDLDMVTAIENLIETDDLTWGDRIVFAYVARCLPRTMLRPSGEKVIGTQMVIAIETRKGFPYGS